MTAYLVFLGLIGAERVVELVLSRRNEAWVLARGGFEVGQGHFRLMTTVHALFLPTCALEVGCSAVRSSRGSGSRCSSS